MHQTKVSIEEATGIVLRKIISEYCEVHGSTYAHLDKAMEAGRSYTSSFMSKSADQWALPGHIKLTRLLSRLGVTQEELQKKAEEHLSGSEA